MAPGPGRTAGAAALGLARAQEEEEQEVEEVEDLMEYYLQRANATQSEAERLLAGALRLHLLVRHLPRPPITAAAAGVRALPHPLPRPARPSPPTPSHPPRPPPAGARDLEESIGVSLSARRFEVNRLELTLSIASFAAAIGAVVAGIFGMNMRSMMEQSVGGFWGVTALIVCGCTFLFLAILRYTRRKRIL